MPEFGEIMAELRKDAGMTQQDLAARLYVAPSTISNYETGQRRAHADFICKVSKVFDVSTDYLLGQTEFSSPFPISTEKYIDGHTVSSVLTQMMSLSDDRRRILCALLGDMQLGEGIAQGKQRIDI